MDATFINGATVVVGENQKEFMGLPVRQTIMTWTDERGRIQEAMVLISEWRPSAEELRALNEGASIFLHLLNIIQHPPVMLVVGPASELAKSTTVKGRPA